MATKKQNTKNIALTAFLLLLSTLSYEAFIPLFLLNILIGFLSQDLDRTKPLKILVPILPVFVALFLKGIYQIYFEKIIFGTGFSRVNIISPMDMLHKFSLSLKSGIRITMLDSVNISIRALNNLKLVSPSYLVAACIFLDCSVCISITYLSHLKIAKSGNIE